MSDLSIYLFATFILLVFGLIILRMPVRRDYLQQGRLSVIVSVLQALLFFTYGGFPALYLPGDWPDVHVVPAIQIIGIVFIFVGLSTLFYGMIWLGILRSLGRGKKDLERSNIYRVTRNPQALACGLYVIGFAILWPSWYAMAWVILYFVLIHVMILTEEDHLYQTYGADYAKYCDEVPRYFRLSFRSR